MNDLVLVDTSIFVEYLRGESDDTLAVLVLNNAVLLSAVVRLELLAGVRKVERPALVKLLGALHVIDEFASLAICESLLERARGSGLFGGIADLLILADAKRYKVPLFTNDRKMRKLAARLKIKVLKRN